MEYKKDIQINEEQKPMSDINRQENILVLKGENKDSVRYDEFEKTLKNRTEKLIMALYMVTDCIEGEDPLKSKIRTLGVEILSDIGRLSRSTYGEKHTILSDFSNKESSLISMLYVSMTVGLISNMNYVILKREFLKVKEDTENKKREVYTTKEESNPSNFDGSIADIFKQDYFTDKQIAQGNIIKDTTPIKDIIKKPYNNVLYKINNKTDLSVIKSHKNLSRALDVGLKVERKNKIIKLIKEKKEVMIKDISRLITDCSEKTIQRELSSLVEQGILNKIGKKRWSRYTLKTL